MQSVIYSMHYGDSVRPSVCHTYNFLPIYGDLWIGTRKSYLSNIVTIIDDLQWPIMANQGHLENQEKWRFPTIRRDLASCSSLSAPSIIGRYYWLIHYIAASEVVSCSSRSVDILTLSVICECRWLISYRDAVVNQRRLQKWRLNPVSTSRVDGPSSRAELTARQLGLTHGVD